MKRNKQGFTIVELVIVIAVIAILAAVLIPTFTSLLQRADRVADEQLLKNMNTALATAEALGNRPENINEVKLVLYESGINAYDSEIHTPKSRALRFVWDKDTNRILLWEKDAELGALILLTDTYMPPVTSGNVPPDDSTPDYVDPPEVCYDLDFISIKTVDGRDAYSVMQGDCHCTDLYIPSRYDGKPVVAITESAFAGTELLSVTIPPSVTTIGAEAFRGCSNLESVTLPRGLETISQKLFYRCENLSEITLPESVKVIDEGAFAYCTDLESISFPEGLTSIGSSAFSFCESLFEVTFPSTPLTLGSSAFANSGIPEIEIPENVSLDQGESAFSSCKWLHTVTLKGSGKIGKQAFENCVSLVDLTLGSRTPGDCSFMDCTGLESVTIGEGVKEIGVSAFSGCTSLSEVTLPSTLETIYEHAFDSCSALESVTLPEGVVSLRPRAFYQCSSLQTVTLPSTLKSLGEDLFAFCTELTTLFYSGNETGWSKVFVAPPKQWQPSFIVKGEGFEAVFSSVPAS